MKDAYYFSHDSNARHDPNILAMRSVYGMEGYGMYWVIVEMLRDQEDYKIKLDKYVWNAIAMQTQCDKQKAHDFVTECISEFRLFDSDGDCFWSNSLLRRMKNKDEKSEKARRSANARWSSERNANAMQTHSEGNANKVKESKENKSKEEEKESSSDSQLTEIFRIYQSEGYGQPSPIAIQEITELYNEYAPEWIMEALKEGVTQNKRRIAYVKSILQNWKTEGGIRRSNGTTYNRGFSREKDRIRDKYRKAGLK